MQQQQEVPPTKLALATQGNTWNGTRVLALHLHLETAVVHLPRQLAVDPVAPDERLDRVDQVLVLLADLINVDIFTKSPGKSVPSEYFQQK